MDKSSNVERAAEETPAPAKKRGRPRTKLNGADAAAGDAGTLSREVIIDAAYQLAHTTPLQDISIALIAKHFEVSPALIHYYVGTRECLTSGAMNKFYEVMYNALPAPSVDWRETLVSAAQTMYGLWIDVPGVASYVVGNNTFRTFQLVFDGSPDYGLEVIEKFTALVKCAGASRKKTGLFSHLIKDFVVSAAVAHITHSHPSQHRELVLDRTAKIARARYPAIVFTKDSLIALDSQDAFMAGLRSLILGLESDELMMD